MFSKILEKTRKGQGLTQKALGEKSKLSPAVISHFEKGRQKPSIDSLRKLADGLDVSADLLLGRKYFNEDIFTGLSQDQKNMVLDLIYLMRERNKNV